MKILRRTLPLVVIASGACALQNPLFLAAPDGAATADAVVLDAGDAAADDRTDASDASSLDASAPDAATTDALVDTAPSDATTTDAEPLDAGSPDVGTPDVGTPDVGTPDAGTPDAGPLDTGTMDSGPSDAGSVDAGSPDTGPMDTGLRDTGPSDTGPSDATAVDAGPPDTGPVDAGPSVVAGASDRCSVTGTAQVSGPGHYMLTGTTSGATNDYRGTCAAGSDMAPDVGFTVTFAGAMHVTWSARPTTSGQFAPAVYWTQDCTVQDARSDHRFFDEVACANNAGAAGQAGGGTMDLPAGTYFVVVDGSMSMTTGNAGAFEVDLVATPAAPATSYTVDPVPALGCTTVPMSGVTTLNDGDDVAAPITALGFGFTFFGQAFDRVAFYSNGFLSFVTTETMASDPGGSWRNTTLPFDHLPRGVVAPFWDDLVLTAGASSVAQAWTDGAAASRVAHVKWTNASFYWDNASAVTFEIRLFQGTNVIEFAYCSESRMNANTRGGSATVGIESYDQTAGRLVGLDVEGTIAPGAGYRFTPR